MFISIDGGVIVAVSEVDPQAACQYLHAPLVTAGPIDIHTHDLDVLTNWINPGSCRNISALLRLFL